MKNFLSKLLICLFCTGLCAQKIDSISDTKDQDTTMVKLKRSPLRMSKTPKTTTQVHSESGKANYLDYKSITHRKDTVLLDTTLSIQKDYKMNFLRKDLFGWQPFQNQGQVMNPLSYNFVGSGLLPQMGARAKHQNYYQIEDIRSYSVPTPSTQFSYRTGFEQGQFLDSWLTFNSHKRLNISIAYKGLRSLGSYRNSLSSHVNFRATVSYQSKNQRYQLNAHMSSQNLENQENGGLTPTALSLFDSNDSEFSDRGRLDVNLENANSTLVGKRYYLDQTYKLFKNKDSLPAQKSHLRLGHEFIYDTKQFYFNSAATTFFGETFKSTTADKTAHKRMQNKVYLDFESPYILGNFRVFSSHDAYYQGYKNVVYSDAQTIGSQLKGTLVAAGAQWKAVIQNISFSANASTSIAGDLRGNQLFVKAAYKNKKDIELAASLQISSKAPDFNLRLFQSNFIAYNWQNNFKNTAVRNLKLDLKSPWVAASASLTQLDNYNYFSADKQSKPMQYESTVNYLQIKAHKELVFWKFSWDNTFQYQNVANGAEVLKVPDFIGRSTFYFSEYLFKKKSLYLQTGITAHYFSAYQANKYHPIIGDFVLQNETKIGGKPLLDFFVNGQIRRTRLFVKAENLLSALNKTNYYATPNQPFRDFTIRFGLVWNFFN
jgi:hypothetical protein